MVKQVYEVWIGNKKGQKGHIKGEAKARRIQSKRKRYFVQFKQNFYCILWLWFYLIINIEEGRTDKAERSGEGKTDITNYTLRRSSQAALRRVNTCPGDSHVFHDVIRCRSAAHSPEFPEYFGEGGMGNHQRQQLRFPDQTK
jgi:hypothetical protein